MASGKINTPFMKFVDVPITNISRKACSGTINGSPTLQVCEKYGLLRIAGRVYISNFSRTGSNPGISFQTDLSPSEYRKYEVGVRGEGEVVYAEAVFFSLNTTGMCELTTSETFSNANHSNRLVLIIPDTIIPIPV